MGKNYLKRIKFSDIDGLCDYMVEANNCSEYVTVISYFPMAEQILKNIMKRDDIRIGIIEMGNESFDYDGEYAIVLYDGELCIEHAWHEKNDFREEGFYNFEEEIVLISGDVPASFVNNCSPELAYELVITDEEDEFSHATPGNEKSVKEENSEKMEVSREQLVESFSKLLDDFFRPWF